MDEVDSAQAPEGLAVVLNRSLRCQLRECRPMSIWKSRRLRRPSVSHHEACMPAVRQPSRFPENPFPTRIVGRDFTDPRGSRYANRAHLPLRGGD
jgi:hypothetical protein